MRCVTAPASTVRAGPVDCAGGVSATVAVPMTVVSWVLVAVTVMLEGAGYGVLSSPVEEMAPGLSELPEGAAMDQVTPPVTPLGSAALNCTCEPMTAEFGVTEMLGET